MAGKCPKCGALVSEAIVTALDLKVVGGQTFRGLSYTCPYCQIILGAQMDPSALEADIVKGVASLLRKG